MNARRLVGAAFVVALVASVWSVSLSGIGPTGWRGFGLFPCELCWYQRVLMYPLPVILGIGLRLRSREAPLYALPLSVAGALVAAYHVLLQARPSLEVSECFVGSCSYVDRMFFGLTIPQLSLVAFVLVSAALVLARRSNASP